MVARWRATRLAFRRQRRIPTDGRRSVGADRTANDRAAFDSILLGPCLVSRRKKHFAPGQSPESWDNRTSRWQSQQDRYRQLSRSGALLRRQLGAGLEMGGLLKEFAQPSARHLHLFVG